MQKFMRTLIYILFLVHMRTQCMNTASSSTIVQTNRQSPIAPAMNNALFPPQNTKNNSPSSVYQSKNNELPLGLFLVLPPAEIYHRPTGLPANACIALPENLQKNSPNEPLTKAILCIKKERYAQAVTELLSIKELSNSDASELALLKKELEAALETSDDQQEKIWKITDILGLENICFLLLHEPLKTFLPAPPNTELALCCSTTYLVYSCWRHAQKRHLLDALKTYLSNISIVPPMYTIAIPRPAIAMTANQPSSSTAIPAKLDLESGKKKDYAGCRIRTHTHHET